MDPNLKVALVAGAVLWFLRHAFAGASAIVDDCLSSNMDESNAVCVAGLLVLGCAGAAIVCFVALFRWAIA